MAQKTLLELDTEAPERALIKIDDKTYELKTGDDLGLKEDAEFRAMWKDHADAEQGKDWERMKVLLERMVSAVVINLPADVLAKLSDAKRLKIVAAFTKEVSAGRQPISAEQAPAAEKVAVA